jgi:hypothetical protein
MTICDDKRPHPRAMDLPVPAIFERVVQPAFLMPGESLSDYQAIRDMIVEEIEPQSGIEWLWVADLIELSWDIVRYRTLRQKMLEVRRREQSKPCCNGLICLEFLMPSGNQHDTTRN